MFFNRKFICSLLLAIFTFPTSSLELIYRQDSDLLFKILCVNSLDIRSLFTKKAQNDSIFSPLLNDCQNTGISKCYDTIIDWTKSKNILEINSIRLSKSIEKFLKSNDFLTEDEKNSLKNLSYLSSIYRSIENRYCNTKVIRKFRKVDITPCWKKLKMCKDQEIKRNRDSKYGII